MTPKDIVVFVEEGPGRDNRLAFAVAVASRWKAHVIATFVARQIGHSPSRCFAVGDGLKCMLQSHQERLQEAEAQTRRFFETLAQSREVTSEWRLFEGESAEALMLHARHASLAIIGPPARPFESTTLLSLSEDIIFGSGRPSLLLPIDWPVDRIARRVVIGWNGSREATQAIAGAMPFLVAAESVHLVVVPEAKVRGLLGPEPGMDISRHLARHGVPVVLEQCAGDDAGAVLLERVRELDADMLVMGAYSRSKVSEILFGGATRTILGGAGCPILLSR